MVWHSLLLLCSLFVAIDAQTAGLVSSPSNDTSYQPSTDPTHRIELAASNTTSLNWTLVPLTDGSGTIISSSYYRSGSLVEANPMSKSATYPNMIVFTNCDPSTYPGQISINDVVNDAVTSNASAVVFYSLSAARCSFANQTFPDYQWFYSMATNSDSTSALAFLNHQSNGSTATSFILTDTVLAEFLQQNGNGGSSGGLSSTSTAVAMIILYSVTGVITILFIVIIVSGAIRAHRHPERYGPRAILGGIRQGRAKGIARAMLDTIPIVKFSSDQQPPKTVDVEMQSSGSRSGPREEEVTTTATADGPEAQMVSSSGEADDAPNCSICTEDFEQGQDIRVLPCGHRFHPACVDPWLLDVSGTCPLCRVDLCPPSGQDGAESQTAELPPPLGGQTAASNSSRLSTFLRRVQPANIEERMAALRRYREERLQDHRNELEVIIQEHESIPRSPSRWRRMMNRTNNSST